MQHHIIIITSTNATNCWLPMHRKLKHPSVAHVLLNVLTSKYTGNNSFRVRRRMSNMFSDKSSRSSGSYSRTARRPIHQRVTEAAVCSLSISFVPICRRIIQFTSKRITVWREVKTRTNVIAGNQCAYQISSFPSQRASCVTFNYFSQYMTSHNSTRAACSYCSNILRQHRRPRHPSCIIPVKRPLT